MVKVREEYRTSLIRGIGSAIVLGAIQFFTLWTQDISIQALISATALATLGPIGAFFGLGVRDARRNDRE